jgi:hypothetical protein
MLLPCNSEAILPAVQQHAAWHTWWVCFAGATITERTALHLDQMVVSCLHSQERVSGCLEFAKLWLFDNRIRDEGAAAVAELLHPGEHACARQRAMVRLM